MYNNAGVNIHIHKFPFGPTGDDIDFNFEIAKALGCKAITTERNDQQVKRLAPFAEKHRIWIAFHNHTNNTPTIEDVDPLMRVSAYIGFNFDIGHYVAGTKGKSPIPVIEKYHQKIISLHLKDRTADGGNLPWGKGQTPIKEVLQLPKFCTFSRGLRNIGRESSKRSADEKEDRIRGRSSFRNELRPLF